jgi:cell wall-associated NlpC family hydrolase
VNRRSGPGRLALAAAAVGLALTAGLAAGLAAVTAGLAAAAPMPSVPSLVALADIPAGYLALYQFAAAGCPGLAWSVLAGVGKVESDHGRSPELVSSAGAEGPMQFLPATWPSYAGDGDGDGRADPFDPADAIPAAARYLCALDVGRDVRAALVSYNCGNPGPACAAAAVGYAARVLTYAAGYATGVPSATAGAGGVAPGPASQLAVRVALGQLGTPYLWGGEEPGGFDCSGLVQFAYATAGVALPRVAQDQYAAGFRLPAGTPPAAGDLVFFGTGPTAVSHVGLFLGDGRMVDAPHTGALVRIDVVDLASRRYVGATRPTAVPGNAPNAAPDRPQPAPAGAR